MCKDPAAGFAIALPAQAATRALVTARSVVDVGFAPGTRRWPLWGTAAVGAARLPPSCARAGMDPRNLGRPADHAPEPAL